MKAITECSGAPRVDRAALFDNGKAAAFRLTPSPVTVSGSRGETPWYRRSGICLPRQTHSLNVAVAESADRDFPDTDALVTFTPGHAVGVVTADCVPILLHAPGIGAVAAVHAGWKGTLGGIIDRTVQLLMDRGADPGELAVVFGPSVSAAIYEVDCELASKFTDAGYGDCVTYPGGPGTKPHLDLQGVNRMRLLRMGVKEERIHLNTECTYLAKGEGGSPLYPSYRRDGTPADRLVTAIRLYNR